MSHCRVRQLDPRLAWFIFHKIAKMYREAKKEKDEYFTHLITNYVESIEGRTLGPKILQFREKSVLNLEEENNKEKKNGERGGESDHSRGKGNTIGSSSGPKRS